MRYCKRGADSDVTAFFHRLGHLVCETCKWSGPHKGSLLVHLEGHRERGDLVPESAFARLRAEMDAVWTQALLEGRRIG